MEPLASEIIVEPNIFQAGKSNRGLAMEVSICSMWQSDLPSGYLLQFAMERFTMLLIGKPIYFNGPFSMAMWNNQRVYIYVYVLYIKLIFFHCHVWWPDGIFDWYTTGIYWGHHEITDQGNNQQWCFSLPKGWNWPVDIFFLSQFEPPKNWQLVGGLEHFFIFHNIWDGNPSHWLSYFSRWLKPPTRQPCEPFDESSQWIPLFGKIILCSSLWHHFSGLTTAWQPSTPSYLQLPSSKVT